MQFREFIEDLCAKEGVSKRKLAESCGIPQNRFTEIISGYRRPDYEAIEKLSDRTGWDLHGLAYEARLEWLKQEQKLLRQYYEENVK